MSKPKEITDELHDIVKPFLNFQAVLIFGLAIAGIGGLGLMNWVELGFDWDRIDQGYINGTILKVLSYGALIASMSFHTLIKRKTVSHEYNSKKSHNEKILNYYRPTRLRVYVDRENHRERKNAFVKKYESKLSSLEKKRTYFDGVMWRAFKQQYSSLEKLEKEETKLEDVLTSYKDLGIKPKKAKTPWFKWFNKLRLIRQEERSRQYVIKRFEYEQLLQNPEDYMYNENVNYDEITVEDITIGVGQKNGGSKTPREKESTAISLGVFKGIMIMFAFNAMLTAMIFTFDDGGVNAIIHTIITMFLVGLSLFRGIINGDTTFENNTMMKMNFQSQHLQGYMVMEAEESNYFIDEFLKTVNKT